MYLFTVPKTKKMNSQKERSQEDLARMEYDVQKSIEEILEYKVKKYLDVFQISSVQTANKKLDEVSKNQRTHPASDVIKQ